MFFKKELSLLIFFFFICFKQDFPLTCRKTLTTQHYYLNLKLAAECRQQLARKLRKFSGTCKWNFVALRVTRPLHPDLCTAGCFILKVEHVASMSHLGLIWEMINRGGALCIWRIENNGTHGNYFAY